MASMQRFEGGAGDQRGIGGGVVGGILGGLLEERRGWRKEFAVGAAAVSAEAVVVVGSASCTAEAALVTLSARMRV